MATATEELRDLRAIAAAAERSVMNPAWAGICDEDVRLEQALLAAGYLRERRRATNNTVDASH